MKRLLYSSLLMMLLMMSCIGNGTGGKDDNDSDSVMVPAMEKPLVPIVGTVGESTTMHVLELVTDDGQSAEFDYEEAIGGADVGDRVLAFTRDDMAVNVVNVTAMSHLWKIVDADSKQHLELHPDFTATSYGMDHDYVSWTCGCPAFSDTPLLFLNYGAGSNGYPLQLLTADSLILYNEGDAIRMVCIN